MRGPPLELGMRPRPPRLEIVKGKLFLVADTIRSETEEVAAAFLLCGESWSTLRVHEPNVMGKDDKQCRVTGVGSKS